VAFVNSWFGSTAVIGNDPINDPEKFDWQSWEDAQIKASERESLKMKAGAGEIDMRTLDRERLERVVGRLAARRDAASGDYRVFFEDRRALAQSWKADLDRGMGLTPDRREGLLDMECTADPELGAKPYRIFASGEEGRFKQVSLRVLRGPTGFFVGAAGGAEGPAYTRLSEELWTDLQTATKALLSGAWTPRQPEKKKRLHR
jgi:hypothetical protein